MTTSSNKVQNWMARRSDQEGRNSIPVDGQFSEIEPANKPNPAWHWWQKSKDSLDALEGMMQQLGTQVSEDQPVAVSPTFKRGVERKIKEFEARFALLIFEQNRKAER